MILNSWKDIASYLHCSVRTAQRCERAGMPVHRPSGHSRSAVVAMTDELDAWRNRPRNEPVSVAHVIARRREVQAFAIALRKQLQECREHSASLRMRVRAIRTIRGYNVTESSKS